MATTSINMKTMQRPESLVLRTVLAALAATAAMTTVMLIVPLLGLPQMNVGRLLGEIYGGASFKGSEALGWTTHFIFGLAFALPYVFLLNRWIPVDNRFLRGTIYGILVYVFSMIMYTTISAAGVFDWNQKEYMGIMAFGNSIACMLYGTVLGAFFYRIGHDEMDEEKREA